MITAVELTNPMDATTIAQAKIHRTSEGNIDFTKSNTFFFSSSPYLG
jgi:hypothetical protein